MTVPVRKAGTYHAVLAGFLGWTLDAFDFFVIVFLYDTLAREFSVSKKAIIFTTTATLALAARRRIAVWRACRSLWTPHSVDGQRHLLFHYRSGMRFRSQLHRVPDFARPLWHRHGRRVGRGRFAGHGSGAASLARRPQRNFAERLLHRLLAGGHRGAHGAAVLGLASHVLAGRVAGACWRCTFAPKCRNRKPGNSIARRV